MRGVSTVAAPVRGADGRIVAAINATASSAAAPSARLRGPIKDRILAAAAEISAQLGAPHVPRRKRA